MKLLRWSCALIAKLKPEIFPLPPKTIPLRYDIVTVYVGVFMRLCLWLSKEVARGQQLTGQQSTFSPDQRGTIIWPWAYLQIHHTYLPLSLACLSPVRQSGLESRLPLVRSRLRSPVCGGRDRLGLESTGYAGQDLRQTRSQVSATPVLGNEQALTDPQYTVLLV